MQSLIQRHRCVRGAAEVVFIATARAHELVPDNTIMIKNHVGGVGVGRSEVCVTEYSIFIVDSVRLYSVIIYIVTTP